MNTQDMASQALSVDVPASEWVTANGRYHWADRARRVRALRFRGLILSRRADLRPVSGRVRVIAHVVTRTRTRMDPANAAPTVKALIDGALVDAGAIPDDDDVHLVGPDFRRGPVCGGLDKGFHRIVLTVTDFEDSYNEV